MDMDVETKNLINILRAVSERNERFKLRKRVAATSGPITAGQCREMCSKRKRTEEKEMRKGIRNERIVRERKDGGPNTDCFFLRKRIILKSI